MRSSNSLCQGLRRWRNWCLFRIGLERRGHFGVVELQKYGGSAKVGMATCIRFVEVVGSSHRGHLVEAALRQVCHPYAVVLKNVERLAEVSMETRTRLVEASRSESSHIAEGDLGKQFETGLKKYGCLVEVELAKHDRALEIVLAR